MNALRDKKILVTAGSTWVALDSVRVITNIFTGALGLRIAEEARRRGAEVTLLMGPTSISLPLKEKPGLRIVRFTISILFTQEFNLWIEQSFKSIE